MSTSHGAAAQPLVEFFEARVPVDAQPFDVLLPSLGKAVQVKHARDGNGFLEVGLFEEEPAHDLRLQVRVVGKVGRSSGKMQQDRARFDDRAPVVEHQDRHA